MSLITDSWLLLFMLPLLKKEHGFTLIELLVTISILAIVVWVALPNINRFNQDQGLRQDVDTLIYDLRLMQSNSQSGVKCSSGDASVYWGIGSISNSSGIGRYNLNSQCRDDAGNITNPSIVKSLANTRLGSHCGTNPEDSTLFLNFYSITFNKVGIEYPCTSSELFNIKLTSIKSSTNFACVFIDSGGAIYEDTCPE